MHTIQINVMGSTGSGKSSVEQEIVDALRNLGFAVKWDVKPDYENEQKARKDGVDRLKRLEAVSDKTTIVVKGFNVRKDINESLNYRVRSHMGRGE